MKLLQSTIFLLVARIGCASFCGCDSCTQEVWDSLATNDNGSYTCGERITWLQTAEGYDETSACIKVSGDEFPNGPCGPVCDPSKCNPPTLAPTPSPPAYCGCDSCSQEIWDSLASDLDGSYTCGARISWLQTQGYDEIGACTKISRDEFPDGPCGPACDPTKCNAVTQAQGLFSEMTGLLSDLESFDDFDPEKDEDGFKTKRLLELTIKCLELLQAANSYDLEREVFSERQAISEAPVSRRPVLTEYTQGEDEPEKGEFQVQVIANDSLFAGALEILCALLNEFAEGDALMGFSTYDRHPSFPDVDLSQAMKKLDGAPPLNQFFSPNKVVRVVRRALEAEMAFELLGREDAVDKAASKEAAYKACFTKSKIFDFLPNPMNFLPEPKHVINHWEEDTEVARQFLSGTNPVMIKVAKRLTQLSGNFVSYFGRSWLRDLIDQKRLFFVSYDDLAELQINPHQAYPLPVNEDAPQDQERYFYAPIIAFVLDEDREELDILGIQLERTPNARVYTRDNSGENEWLFAKACVTTADSNMHEWVSHLGNTHLTMEPHIISIYNVLRRAKHPLYTFLKPLCKDTLFLNWAARLTLASYEPKSFGDHQSSVGVGQFMQLIGKMWSRYSFFEKSAFPSEVASRGFDEDFDMPTYLYREDGTKLWNAYGKFATDFVDELYPSHRDVAADTVLQDWAIETTDLDRGAVPGFPTSFEDKGTLALTLQTLMWISGGLHAAVNFPQYDYYAFAPNKPLAMRASLSSLPEDDSAIRTWMFESFFPHVSSGDDWLKSSTTTGRDAALDSLVMVHILTLPSDHCIDNLSDQFVTIGEEAYSKFVDNLDEIGDGIEERNRASKDAGEATYSYLNPSVVPASIDI